MTTFNFGADTDADLYCNFLASGGPRWLGVRITADGNVATFGDGNATATDVALGDVRGQSVTVIAKFFYDVGTGQATMTLWLNPTFSSLESAGDASTVWSSNMMMGRCQDERRNQLTKAHSLPNIIAIPVTARIGRLPRLGKRPISPWPR